MIKLQKKQIKIFAVALALVFIGSVVALGVSQLQSATGVANAASSAVGVVDFRQCMSQSPDLAAANAQLQQAIEEAKADFEAKAASMSEQEQAQYYQQTQERLAQKQQDIIDPIQKKVEATVKTVAEAKGLSVVIDKGAVVYGGNDITRDVIAKLGK